MFCEEAFKRLSTIVQHSVGKFKFLRTKAEELEGDVAHFSFPPPSTVPEDEALCLPSEVSGLEVLLD